MHLVLLLYHYSSLASLHLASHKDAGHSTLGLHLYLLNYFPKAPSPRQSHQSTQLSPQCNSNPFFKFSRKTGKGKNEWKERMKNWSQLWVTVQFQGQHPTWRWKERWPWWTESLKVKAIWRMKLIKQAWGQKSHSNLNRYGKSFWQNHTFLCNKKSLRD